MRRYGPAGSYGENRKCLSCLPPVSYTHLMLELNQQKLHELEAKCTKEQPPAAMAACPLHVDCREICRAIAASDFSKARELYEKNAVFPGILSHLCEEPCKSACIRTCLLYTSRCV